LPKRREHTDAALPLGPQSLVWRYFGDQRMFLIGPRPAVLQNMLAELGQGVLDHPCSFDGHRGAHQAVAAADIHDGLRLRTADNPGQQVRDFHTQIKGSMPDGKRYHALDPDTYFLGARHVRRAGAVLRRHLRQAVDTG